MKLDTNDGQPLQALIAGGMRQTLRDGAWAVRE